MPERRLSALLRSLLRFALGYGMLSYSSRHDDPRLAGDRHFLTRRIMQFTWRRFQPVAASAPAIYRQLSAVATPDPRLVFIIPTILSRFGPRYECLFAALCTNYVCLLLAAWLAGTIAPHELKSRLCRQPWRERTALLSFNTQASVITTLSEGLSRLMLALAFLFYPSAWRWLPCIGGGDGGRKTTTRNPAASPA